MGPNEITVMPCFSLEPNKLVSFNRVFRRSNYDEYGNRRQKTKLLHSTNWSDKAKSNAIKRAHHNLMLSDNAYRTLKRRINWLYYLAKSRHVKTYSGKDIYNFKIAFLTLTLPSKQRTCTAEITKVLFNQFLTEIRQRTKVENYIWRLEFQKNGNAHYHIITDTYLDYFFAQKIWNRILSNNGYVQPYTDKHSAMSLHDYNLTYNSDGKTDFSVIAKRYASGKKTGWTQPPTIDVKSVQSKKAIANYISKYFSKDANHATIQNELDNDDNTENIRLWFCSRSLSKLSSVSDFCEAVDYDIFSLVGCCKKIRKVFCQYATIIYYDLLEFSHWSRSQVEMLLKDYSKKQGYIPAS